MCDSYRLLESIFGLFSCDTWSHLYEMGTITLSTQLPVIVQI